MRSADLGTRSSARSLSPPHTPLRFVHEQVRGRIERADWSKAAGWLRRRGESGRDVTNRRDERAGKRDRRLSRFVVDVLVFSCIPDRRPRSSAPRLGYWIFLFPSVSPPFFVGGMMTEWKIIMVIWQFGSPDYDCFPNQFVGLHFVQEFVHFRW